MKQLDKLPDFIQRKFYAWVTSVELAGIRAVPERSGFHDEPLKGERQTNMNTKKRFGVKSLEEKFGPMTVGVFLRAFRESEGLSQTTFAKKLKISRANVCDLEKGRKNISPERAVKIAKILGVPETVLIQLSIQDTLRAAHLNYIVEIKKVS